MSDMRVAETILAQLGGKRFVFMTGARNFVGSSNSLSLRIPKAKDGINCVRVTLTPMDVYTVEFLRIRGTTVTVVERLDGVYNDMLQEVFERHTGLVTKL